MMGIYIPRARREQLRKYVYSSTDKSLVSVSLFSAVALAPGLRHPRHGEGG